MNVPVQIVGVHVDAQSGAPIVLLSELVDDGRVLPIFVGPAEANAIILGLKGIQPPRPHTHDLILEVLDALDTRLTSVVITELRGGTFIAELEIDGPEQSQQVSARPSDSIALAVRHDVPILVSPAVLDEAGVRMDRADDEPLDEEEVEQIMTQFHEFLDDADPSDFA